MSEEKIKSEKEIVRYMTPKKRKLLRIISENLGKEGFTKTMCEMMIEAGYSKNSALQQTAILAGIQEELKPISDKLDELREKAIKRLNDGNLTDKANYRDLVDGIDKLTKNIQLIKGKPTGIGAVLNINQLLDDINQGKFPEIE